MQLAQAGENLKALREIADVLIAEAKAGNIQAIRELADRLDGKPVQQMPELPALNGGERRKLTYEIVYTSEETLRAEQEREAEQQREAEEIDDVEYREVKMIGNGSGGNGSANGNGHERE